MLYSKFCGIKSENKISMQEIILVLFAHTLMYSLNENKTLNLTKIKYINLFCSIALYDCISSFVLKDL